MKNRIIRKAKLALIATGARPSHLLEACSQLLKFSAWVQTTNSRNRPYFQDRFDLYTYVHGELIKADPVDYLEFGVFRGGSLKRWTELNSHPASRFYGFDTFEGLPEEWKVSTRTLEKGHFSTQGVPPDISDSRVTFIKGLFQDSLPPFLADFKPKNRLVVH